MLPFELTKDTPYLALLGELWSVLYEYFNRNWLCYKGFLLYKQYSSIGLDNGFALTRWPAIIWSDVGKFTDTYLHHSASMN